MVNSRNIPKTPKAPHSRCACCLYFIGVGPEKIAKLMRLSSRKQPTRWARCYGLKINAPGRNSLAKTPTGMADVYSAIMQGYRKDIKQFDANERKWSIYFNKRKNKPYTSEQHKKLMSDPAYKAKFYARKRVRNFLLTKGKHKRRMGISKWIGCTGRFLKQYIEQRFKPGMRWDNYGSMWVIDHVIPLASANLNNIREVKRLSHYTNLMPSFKWENMKKRDKTMRQQELIVTC